MSQPPFSTSALRGAIDLSALKPPAAPAGSPSGRTRTGSGAVAASGLVVEATDAGFEQVVSASLTVPAILVLWSPRDQVSMDFVDVMAGVARANGGAFRLVTVDVDRNPGVLRAFQATAVPMTIGLVQGQPVPLFEDAVLPQQIQPVVDQLLALAAQHGVTGRVEGGDAPGAEATEADGAGQEVEPPLPPLHQAAFDAIEAGDLSAAVTAYEQALKDSPADAEAKVGLSQVRLMQRTEGVDLQSARAAAAAAPADVDAQLVVADLDVLGGHVEDAFVRLIDLVRVTSDAERNRVREHLLELFTIVGSTDERVAKARKALMSALF